ncbi:ornithine cyclodeaminase family protein [Winogradskyella sp. PG-2]|uniref:ornithine cyclodeaminase family protein n=1 Tax=Winogradskyella sp. PG-2 TaxID=754409 RepID=UPI000458895B|nr:ornithine cyclodeaminase family protein [Winogradskyella sp. PG-2]BAO74619.1 ornithine cyclodeaminase [Winogradskyella sp. PG-2]
MEKKTLILSANDVNQILETYGLNRLMDTLIKRTTDHIRSYDPEKTEIPIRSGFNYENNDPGLIEWMPVHKKGDEVVIKVVGYHPRNPQKYYLPTILSSISSYDTTTGHLKGLADGVLLTALRTGAASAVASQVLAKTQSSTLGLIGCGAQAVTQLHALSRVFDIKKVMLYDVDDKAMNTFSDRITMLDLNLEIVFSSINDILNTSDIVCTETSIDVGTGPLFYNLKTSDHLHINAIGSDFPGKVELPLNFLKQSLVCPDFLEQAKIEGECQQLEDSEIGPVLSDLVKHSEDYVYAKNQRTVFDSTGWALEDQIVMDLFLDLAKEFGIGQEIALENISEDAKNPYSFMLKAVSV